MASKLPVLFVSHGSPMFALESDILGDKLKNLGQQLPKDKIKAVLVLSAHWLTPNGVRITHNEAPETIHDFGGFPDELYQLQYPAKGAPSIAQLVQETLIEKGVNAKLDDVRGLDHGAWVPLLYLLPEQDLPVIQASVPYPSSTEQMAEFGQMLNVLREQGILIIASGSQTHNLRDVFSGTSDASYVTEFTSWVREAVMSHDLDRLIHYRQLAPHAQKAHPTEEHFVPLIIALGASDKEDKVTLIDGGVTYQALSMDAYVFGDLYG